MMDTVEKELNIVQVSLDTKEFKGGLKNVMKFVPKATAPTYGNQIELSSNDQGTINLRVFNTKSHEHVSFTRLVNAQVNNTFKVVVDSKLLDKILKKVKSAQLELQLTADDKLSIVFGKKKFSLELLDSEFPLDLSNKDFDAGIQLNAEQLFSAYKRVLPNISREESRPILLGINHVFSKNGLDIHATDARRLGREILHDVHSDVEKSLNVEGNTIKNLLKVSWEKEILLQSNEDRSIVQFSDGLNKIQIDTLQGNYPDVDRLIQRDGYKQVLTVDSTKFNESLDMAKIIAENSRALCVYFNYNHNEKNLLLHAEDTKNEYNETIGQPEMLDDTKMFDIAFNPEYMKDQMSAFEKNTQVKINMTQPLRPIVIKPINVSYDYVGLVTPMRTF